MSLIAGFLTVVMLLNCVFLILLILVQLPKKEAGAGIAFGGGAADALFGAGSGNALTKLTKYCAGLFIFLALVLSMMSTHRQGAGSRSIDDVLEKKSATAPVIPVNAPSTTSTLTNLPPSASSNSLNLEMQTVPGQTAATNPAVPAPGGSNPGGQ